MTDAATLRENITRANVLIKALQFIAAHAYLFPDGFAVWGYEIEAWFYGDGAKEAIALAARTIRREFKIPMTGKNYADATFRITLEIPDSPVYIRLLTPRANVCVKVETGETRTVMVPDFSAAPMVAKEEVVTEWICEPLLDSA